jgi:hypothetical protein
VGAFEGHDVGMVDEPVDHGGGHDVIAEDVAPSARTVCCWRRSGWPVRSGRNKLEEQVGRFGFEGV